MISTLIKNNGYKNKIILFLFLMVTIICFYWYALPHVRKLPFLIDSNKVTEDHSSKPSLSNIFANLSSNNFLFAPNFSSSPKLNSVDTLPFDIDSTDVIVFLHIQKTGGTSFGRHLIHDLNTRKCTKKVDGVKTWSCLRPNEDTEWIFSRYTTGWYCGLHADWTSLTECVPDYFNDPIENQKRRYFYFTILRDPVARFLSEWGHVSRGATWDRAYLRCNGEEYEYPLCYNGQNWRDVSLDEFMDCEDNLANNRQTRMLSNLRSINCTGGDFDDDEKDQIMLETAKKNLQNMLFFGLVEYQRETQMLFETTFNLYFNVKFTFDNETRVSKFYETEEQLKRVKELNHLDIQLYEFALNLLKERFKAIT